MTLLPLLPYNPLPPPLPHQPTLTKSSADTLLRS
jgi:hypothetical protein